MSDQYRQARDRVVSGVLALLASGKYSRVQELSMGSRLSAAKVQQAVIEYGRTVTPLPENAVERIDYVEVAGSHPSAWSARAPVFTRGEGRSDLSLELTLFESGADSYRFEVDGPHVM